MYHRFSLDTIGLREKLAVARLELEALWASLKPDHNKGQAVTNEAATQQVEPAKKRNPFLVNCRRKFGDRSWSCPGAGAGC